jgi:hypothetical protein
LKREIARGMSGVLASPPTALPAGVRIEMIGLLQMIRYEEVYSQGDEMALGKEF